MNELNKLEGLRSELATMRERLIRIYAESDLDERNSLKAAANHLAVVVSGLEMEIGLIENAETRRPDATR
jgi:hypothetical protein